MPKISEELTGVFYLISAVLSFIIGAFTFYSWYTIGVIPSYLLGIIFFIIILSITVKYRAGIRNQIIRFKTLFMGHLEALRTGIHPEMRKELKEGLEELRRNIRQYMKDEARQIVKSEVRQFLSSRKPGIRKICDAEIIVPQKGQKNLPFDLDISGKVNTKIIGKLQATGGSGNDIRFYVFDNHNYTKFCENHPYRSLDDSGKVSIYTFEVPITHTGRYYFLFDNTFSFLSPKTVKIVAKLSFESLEIID